MDKNIKKNTSVICWIARILGTVLAVYLVFTTVAGLIMNFGNLDLIVYGSTAFIIILILVTSAVAVSIFSIIAGLNNPNFDLMDLIILVGLPFLIIGILFLVSWWKSRKLSASQ
ncbi:MAG: hypothetical protein NTV16_06675 [Actinobacteria bacterium]|nr:hypothetical protein [Actinomycetota bacterium]